MDKPASQNGRQISTEKRIIAGARAEFIAYGFRGARMQAIADRCEVNKALLHYYFRSKERLYDAVFTDIAHTMRDALMQQFASFDTVGDIGTFLRNVVTVYVNTLARNSDFPQFILRELADGGSRLPMLITSIAPTVSFVPVAVETLFRREIEAGHIRRVSYVHAMLNIISMCVFTFIAKPIAAELDKFVGGSITYDETFFRERIDSIVDMALHGIASQSPEQGCI